MARAGLGGAWSCLFANDFDFKKGESYSRNWGKSELYVSDIRDVKIDILPGFADLAWASFPCQDLSLAGAGAGLKGERSGTFWPFWRIIEQLDAQNRAPTLILLENVIGTLTSHQGKDFRAICDSLAANGYLFGAVVADARHFVPQSRPRLFIIATKQRGEILKDLIGAGPSQHWHTPALCSAAKTLTGAAKKSWIWWNLSAPPERRIAIANIIEKSPRDVEWNSDEETQALLSKMTKAHLKKIEVARAGKKELIGTAYRRTRFDASGEKVQRVEVRFDGLAGCLRTPAGGSSRQIVFVVKSNTIRSRLMSARETARLMGLPESYVLPNNYNEAYHLTGDGVAVPVVSFISKNILEPLLAKKVRIAAE